MVLEGATLYYKKMHSIDDQVCMNTYDGSKGGAMIALYFIVQLLKHYFISLPSSFYILVS